MSDFEDGEYVGSSINLVKKFFHQPSQQSLAVKFIIIPGRRNKRDNERLAKAREKLIREIKLHKTLVDSQNIVTFYGACLYNEQALIYALFDCKSEEIIHRDVKPDNILMNYAGQIKLCDLGVSRILKNSFATTVVGTTHYWPPEHFTQQEAFDIRADIWSLGITLAEIARGKYPLVEDVSNYNLVTIGQVILEMNASTKAGLIEDIFKTYSQETKNFVHDCLKELNNRPKLDQLRNSGNDFGKFYVKYSQLKEPNYVAILIKEALEESETN
uniref:mitogen-activated protein kinase kinase n=1 Tax=Acrobeloides nanus TaxID=290746 RepID=A0A914CY26_9BILA